MQNILTKTFNIIITTVPTGLGHIRVTNAILKGLPLTQNATIIGIKDPTTALFYRIISTNFYLRKILEFTQTNPVAEKITNDIISFLQTQDTKDTEQKLVQTINPDYPTIVVSTHAFIAHKIQKIINSRKFKKPIFHAVIVTDDSPQRFWMIDANIIFVPSQNTKQQLLQKYKEDNHKAPNIEVVPYPINPEFCLKLRTEILYNKIEQLEPDNPQKARVCIPVSGAAVQLDFYKTLIEKLLQEQTQKNSTQFTFSVVTREGNYTKPFIDYFRENNNISFHIGANDEQTVELYDQLYSQLNPPSLEITKPSEQCFKVLTTPDTLGGPIILLTEPVGRQEYDNLNYLERNGFLPTEKTTALLLQAFQNNNLHTIQTYVSYASSWRAIRLPKSPQEASEFIIGCHAFGIFIAMQNYKNHKTDPSLTPNGVREIWKKIFELQIK